jgi:cytochrome c biogenesis protein CcdA
MVETLTPAVCGSRQRYRVALALFALGAILAAGVLGAFLGLAGSTLDRRSALAVVAVLALIGAVREAGLLRIPLPELRRQVPERWRREWPLPAWSLGYGAGLGLGVLTHQTVASFWVAATGALALGDPLVSAACLVPFGVGRAVMVALPARGGRDPARAVGRLIERRRRLRPANALVLALAAVAFAASPAFGQGSTQGEYDPAASGRVSAVSVADAAGAAVLVRPARLPEVRFADGRSPALDGDLLAYADAAGLRIVRWRTGEEVARLDGSLTKPALDYPRVAYIRVVPGGQRLELRNLVTGALRTVAQGGRDVDIGRPALRAGRIAWHVAAGRRSQIRLGPADGSRPATVVASSVTGLQVNPSLAYGRILWVEQAGSISALRIRRTGGGSVRTLTTLRGPNRILWTTALGLRTAYVTRWNPVNGRSEIVTRRWR